MPTHNKPAPVEHPPAPPLPAWVGWITVGRGKPWRRVCAAATPHQCEKLARAFARRRLAAAR
jgi:hypothetical protein